jgi:hypothetical protein
MARFEIAGRIYEIPDAELLRLIESYNQSNVGSGNYPIANREDSWNEYGIQTSETLTPVEIQPHLGNGFIPVDFNSERQRVKPFEFGLQL